MVHIPLDYTSFLPPARGQSYPDPVLGCSVTRLSDGPAQFGTAVHHEYASMSPFNRDNSRVLLLTGTGTFFLVDPQGNVVVSPGVLGVGGLDEPRWSPKNPNIFFFHQGNVLKKYNLASGQASNVRNFFEYSSIDFGGGESDISDDGDHIVIVGDNRFVQVYQFSTDTFGPALDLQGRAFDWFDMTPNNHVLANYGTGGTDRFQGLELYDQNMNFIRQVIPFVGHADRGRDLNGDEIIVITNNNDFSPLAGCTPGIVKVRLSDSVETCLVSFQRATASGGAWWNTSPHVSVNNSGGHPWALISITDTSQPGTAQPNGELPTDWLARWGVYFNELFLAKLDGSEVRRLAHHRSRPISLTDGALYWKLPRAAISRDGRYVLFDSDFAQGGTGSYSEVFLITVQ